MKKQRRQNQQKPASTAVTAKDQGASIGDALSLDIAAKLKQLKREKEQELQRLKEEEEAKRIFEQKQREKNKTFEDLLNETPMDWKKFK